MAAHDVVATLEIRVNLLVLLYSNIWGLLGHLNGILLLVELTELNLKLTDTLLKAFELISYQLRAEVLNQINNASDVQLVVACVGRVHGVGFQHLFEAVVERRSVHNQQGVTLLGTTCVL